MTLFELIEKNLKKQGGAEKWNLRQVLTRIALVSINGMFKYENLPDSIRPEYLEEFLHTDGTAVLYKEETADNMPIAASGFYAGSTDSFGLDVYGLGKGVIATTLNGIERRLIPDKDCVVVWNNSAMMSDMHIINLAVDYLTELFTSLKSNIIYSRLKPIFRADDKTIKAAIENAFKQVADDEPIVITSENVLAKLVEGSSWQDVNVLNITDPENSNKLQFLVKSIDDIMRWIYGLYGQTIQGNGKMAQQTVDEVNGQTSISFIIPNNMLAERRKAIAKFNEIFGYDVTVDFSTAWKTEETKYTAQADKIEAEAEKTEAEADAADEPETQPEEQTEESEVKEDAE